MSYQELQLDILEYHPPISCDTMNWFCKLKIYVLEDFTVLL